LKKAPGRAEQNYFIQQFFVTISQENNYNAVKEQLGEGITVKRNL